MPATTELFYFGLNDGPNTIAQFSKTTYRSARVTIQASSGQEHQLSEVYLMHDNTLAYIRELNFIYTSDPFVDFTATIDANNVYLKANTTLPNTDIVIFADLFDNPVTSATQEIDLTSIISTTEAMSAMYPDSDEDYAESLTSSLNKEDEVYQLQRKIEDSIGYMKTSEFLAESDGYKENYLNELANSINNMSSSLSAAVDSDVQNYFNMSRKIESMTSLSGIQTAFSRGGAASKKILGRVLNEETKSAFAAKK